jgi:hypothetical protein
MKTPIESAIAAAAGRTGRRVFYAGSAI